jgi:hypothetical protein
VDLEKEVFAECGAWKNFHELEDSLSFDELLVLFDVTSERFKRNAEVMVGAMGGSIGGGGEFSSEDDRNIQVADAQSLKQLPFGIGHTTIEGE